MTIMSHSIWTPAIDRGESRLGAWWRKARKFRDDVMEMAGHLKRGPGGHLLYGPTGHLVWQCAINCSYCTSVNNASTYTVTLSGVNICPPGTYNITNSIGTIGQIKVISGTTVDGTYSLTKASSYTATNCLWQLVINPYTNISVSNDNFDGSGFVPSQVFILNLLRTSGFWSVQAFIARNPPSMVGPGGQLFSNGLSEGSVQCLNTFTISNGNPAPNCGLSILGRQNGELGTGGTASVSNP